MADRGSAVQRVVALLGCVVYLLHLRGRREIAAPICWAGAMSEVDKWFSEWSGQHESEVTAELPPDVLVRMRQQMFTEDIPVGDESDEKLLSWEERVRMRAERDRLVVLTATGYDNLIARAVNAEAEERRVRRQLMRCQILNAAIWGVLTLSLGITLWAVSR